MGARISVSSMRTDPISVPLVQAMAASGTQTLTIAPEAGTERLRRVISKRQTEDDLLAAVELAQTLGFPLLKIYFMIGHPTETDDDIQGIVDLTLKARAHLPAQHRHQRHALRAQGAHALSVGGDDAGQDAPGAPEACSDARWRSTRWRSTPTRRQWAEVQAVLARGDRRLAPVLLDLPQLPCPAASGAALARHGLTAASSWAQRGPATSLPWDVVESGVKTTYLRYELRLSER